MHNLDNDDKDNYNDDNNNDNDGGERASTITHCRRCHCQRRQMDGATILMMPMMTQDNAFNQAEKTTTNK